MSWTDSGRSWNMWWGHNKAGLILIEQPAYVSWISDLLAWLDFDWVHRIPLPKWPPIIYDKEDDKWYSLEEEWSDLGCIWYHLILVPGTNWIYDHPRRKEIMLTLPTEQILDELMVHFDSDEREWARNFLSQEAFHETKNESDL